MSKYSEWATKMRAKNPNYFKEAGRKARRDHPERSYLYHIKWAYGLTKEAWERITAKQRGHCWICQRHVKLVVDHDHRTTKFRALLCNRCNTGLGYFEHSPHLLERAIRHLQGMNPGNEEPYLTPMFDLDRIAACTRTNTGSGYRSRKSGGNPPDSPQNNHDI